MTKIETQMNKNGRNIFGTGTTVSASKFMTPTTFIDIW